MSASPPRRLSEDDVALLARLATTDQPDAVRALRAHLRGA